MYPPNPLREELLVEPLPIVKDSCIAVPQGHGLGVELDPKALARFRQS
jgi:L-alanine-DL-glutamate epimerase-like enolase superfamily enzyme